MDEPVWTNSMCNELGRMSQGWKKYSVINTLELILNKDKTKDRKATYVREVCDIRQKKQKLTEQDSLQEEILYTIQKNSSQSHQN